MVSQPEKWIEPFAQAGAHCITIHAEATPHLNGVLHQIRHHGCQVGVSLNPGTSLSLIEEVLDIVDIVLVMSVNPGWGGQKMIEGTLKKIEKLVQLRGHRKFLIEVDGGVNSTNICSLKNVGAEVFVVGSAVFGAINRKKAMDQLRASIGDL